jgi:hypothetical protein
MYNKNYPSGIKDFLRHYGEVGVPEEQKQGYLGVRGIFEYVKVIPDNISLILFITFILGLFFCLDFLLAPDILFKDLELQRNLFLFLFIFPPLIYHGMKSLNIEERYLIGILPIVLIIAGFGVFKIYSYLTNYKYAVLGVISITLIIIAFSQVNSASDIINARKDSYFQVKDAALWMKENSNSTDVIISNSIPQTQYYSDRSTYYIEDEQEIKKLNPKFYVVSVYEKSAESYYLYPEKNKDNLQLVNAYFLDPQETQPSLVIYEFIKN